MTYEENMLARTGGYLEHFGIKGQKWGVRRYQNQDGTLTEAGKQHYSVSTGGNKKLANKYFKEKKKLNKLTDKADIDKQKANADKYDARARTAAKIGSAAGLATLGIGAAGEISNRDHISKGIRLNKRFEDLYTDPTASPYLRKSLLWDMEDNDKNRMLNNTAATAAGAVTGATAVGALGYAGYNKAKAAIAKSRTTEKGHAKAVARRQEQFDKMMNTFAGTPYADLLKKQK